MGSPHKFSFTEPQPIFSNGAFFKAYYSMGMSCILCGNNSHGFNQPQTRKIWSIFEGVDSGCHLLHPVAGIKVNGNVYEFSTSCAVDASPVDLSFWSVQLI